MKVRLRLFAWYAEAFGREEIPLELAEGASVADCLAAIRTEPAAARLPPSPLVAVNLRYARLETALREGDEVALIPPIAGG
jgi:molybdopterin converting factor small subunit